MPIYEYRCNACGHKLETMQRISAAPLTRCPECGDDALQRLISQTSFILKGTGWYATDYQSKPTDPSANGADTAHGAESKSEAKSESKSESKSEPPVSGAPKHDAKPDKAAAPS